MNGNELKETENQPEGIKETEKEPEGTQKERNRT